jgi:hypothetical protein
MEIPLTQGKVAVIDDEDYPLIARFRWYARRQPRGNDLWYAVTNRPQADGRRPSPACYLMHRVITGIADAGRGPHVDHRNHDGLDNRRSNLRLSDQAHNNGNQRKQRRTTTSRYKGVYWSSTYGCWIAEIKLGTRRHLGRFTEESAAALAYNAAARDLFGEFAFVNNVPEMEIS